MKNKILIPAILISLIAGFFGGIEYQKSQESSGGGLKELINKESGRPETIDFSLFWDAWNLVHKRYVDRSDLNTQEMVFGAIEGMIKSIGDPFTVFLKEEQSKRLQEDISGEFFGVGIEIGMRDGALTVIAPLKGSPAEKAGILAGDKIIKIDAESTIDMTLDAAVSKIRGRRGSKVTMVVLRKLDGKEETKDFEIIRERIKIPTVEWKKIDSSIGYIQLFSFNQIAKSEFDKALNELKKAGADKKMILDLRNNPGGLLDLAIDISSYFLEPGQVVVVEDFGNGEKDELKAKPNGQLNNVKMVILINKGSASASEIVAGALHDNKGVKLVGERTFGKGSVQQVEELRFKTALKITVAKWLTPKGRSISDEGIEPDIAVERTEEDIKNDRDPQLDKAIEIIKSL